MSRINYSKNAHTDCNYSFCEDQENLCPNPLDDLSRVLKRHYQLHLKNAHTIKQQASQIHRMQQAILNIESKLTGHSHHYNSQHHQNSISSISKKESSSYYQQSIQSFPSKQTSRSKRNQSATSRCSSNIKTASIGKHKHKSKIISNTLSSNSSNSSFSGNNAKLLSSIVQRKLNIEKELKERLRNHLLPQQKTKMKTSVNYITYATQR